MSNVTGVLSKLIEIKSKNSLGTMNDSIAIFHVVSIIYSIDEEVKSPNAFYR